MTPKKIKKRAKKIAKLPMWELMALAVQDLESVIPADMYRVQMSDWHAPLETATGNRVCRVCLAGAVMARSLGASPDQYALPKYYPQKTERALRAIDEFRGGNIRRAFKLRRMTWSGAEHWDMPIFDDREPQEYINKMWQIVAKLRDEECGSD